MIITTLLLTITGYLFGSLSSAIILCRIAGLPDPREQGSGNPGATNVLRFGGKKLAVLVLVGDVVKGFAPVLAALLLQLPPVGIALVAAAAFGGHLYPLFFGFRGGKGVATAVGTVFALSWPCALTLIGVWLVASAIFRISSLAALIAAGAAPLNIWYWTHEPSYVVVITLMAVFLLWRHRSNIRNLLQGTEPKIGGKK